MAGSAGAAASFTLSVSPSSVNGSYHGSSGAAQNITTSVALAVPSGGKTPYTYAWAQVGTSPDTWTIATPAGASTSFTATAIAAGADASATFQVTVTDANGIIRTAQVFAHALNVSTA
jgi:hypothetical protein